LFKVRGVAVVFRQQGCQSRLSRPDVSGDGNVHNLGFVQPAK